MSSRHKGRKRALDILYAADVRGRPLSELLAEEAARASAEPSRESSWLFAQDIVSAVVARQDEIDDLIRQNSSWPLERMPSIDRALLRLATAELLVHPDTPIAVVIAEAGELASEYSTDDSRSFVQGVLGTLAEKTRLHE